MGVTDKTPDTDPIIQSSLQLDVVYHFLCDYNGLSTSAIDVWQQLLFRFGAQLVDKLKLDVSTKLHRLMRHLHHQLIDYGCVFRASSKGNESLNKLFKVAYAHNKLHIYKIGSQLLHATLEDNTNVTSYLDLITIEDQQTTTTPLTYDQYNSWSALSAAA